MLAITFKSFLYDYYRFNNYLKTVRLLKDIIYIKIRNFTRLFGHFTYLAR